MSAAARVFRTGAVVIAMFPIMVGEERCIENTFSRRSIT
jgi:hypothetical protein